MRRRPLAGPSDRFGYAVGTALVFVPLLGIPVRFAIQEIAPVLVYVASFLVGLLAGWLFAPRERLDNG